MGSRPITGKVCRGTNYDRKTMENFDKAKHMDLQIELENRKAQLVMQENLVRRLKDKIFRHKNEKGCNDISVESCDSQYMQDSQVSQN